MAPAPAGKSPVNRNRLAKPPAVELPVPEAETYRPSTAPLTAVLAVCFSLGVAWPVFGGLDFVQRPPGSAPLKPPVNEGPPSEPDPNAVPGEVPALHVAPMVTTSEAVLVEGTQVQSCLGDRGEVAARCDEPRVQKVLEQPIAKLAACDAANGLSGVLSLGVYLDFSSGRVTRVKAGQSTTLSKRETAALMTCAEEEIVGTLLDDVEHEHGRYWLYYRVRFLPPGSPIDPEAAAAPLEVVEASGQGTIGWTTAIVRDAPSPKGKVEARLSYGTRINVTGRAGDWYRIEHGGQRLGWVHRKAIGM
jgi:hypothetical protein